MGCVGSTVGCPLGTDVGKIVGCPEGSEVGCPVGTMEGTLLGMLVGTTGGMWVGRLEGDSVLYSKKRLLRTWKGSLHCWYLPPPPRSVAVVKVKYSLDPSSLKVISKGFGPGRPVFDDTTEMVPLL